jgi:hypothetical protein
MIVDRDLLSKFGIDILLNFHFLLDSIKKNNNSFYKPIKLEFLDFLIVPSTFYQIHDIFPKKENNFFVIFRHSANSSFFVQKTNLFKQNIAVISKHTKHKKSLIFESNCPSSKQTCTN